MKDKIKVSVYTNSHYISPSSYYRINQYIDKMGDEPFEIEKHYAQTDKFKKWYLTIERANKLKHKVAQAICYIQQYFRLLHALLRDNFVYHPDVVIVLRAMIGRKATPLLCYLLNRLVSKATLLWDFDDNIFKSGEIDPRIAQVLTTHADKVTVTSRFLREQLPTLPDNKFLYLPTSDGDMYNLYCTKFIKERSMRFSDEIAIVWVATAVNLPFLEKAVVFIDRAAEIIWKRYHKRLVLEVVCNGELRYQAKSLDIRNIRWKRDVATERMLKAHIGIMPLEDNEFTRGKGGFKLIQYMSVGLPIIASNVGYNAEVVTPEMKGGFLLDTFEKWTDTLVTMATDDELLRQMGVASRQAWEKRFSYETNYRTWVELIKYKKGSNNF